MDVQTHSMGFTPKPAGNGVAVSGALLTVSGEVPVDLDSQVGEGRRPRADFRAMQEYFGADLVDVRAALDRRPKLGPMLQRLVGVGGLLAWDCFRRRDGYRVIVTDGEQVGIPLALLLRVFGRRGTRHVMIVHVVSPRKKALPIRAFRLAGMIDRWIVYCSAQADYIEHHFGVAPARIVSTTFMVDTDFFDPQRENTSGEREGSRPMICAVGLERRDYPTLMRAVGDLDVDVVIAAASPWSKQSSSADREFVPVNVTVAKFSQAELRSLYARCAFSVMPLIEVDFQAGITAILESMAMERTVVCSRTTGQTDTIIDISDGAPQRSTGRYVTTGDVASMRAAISRLLDDPDEARQLGREARTWVVEHADVEVYAQRLSGVLTDVVDGPSASS